MLCLKNRRKALWLRNTEAEESGYNEIKRWGLDLGGFSYINQKVSPGFSGEEWHALIYISQRLLWSLYEEQIGVAQVLV